MPTPKPKTAKSAKTPKDYAADSGANLDADTEPSAPSAATTPPDPAPLSRPLGTYARLPLACIVPSLTNPRTTFAHGPLQELADSISATEQDTPITIRPLPLARVPHVDFAVTHEIVFGERRWRACGLAGLQYIDTLCRDLTDAQVLEKQLVENLQREDLTALEEAEGYKKLVDLNGITVDEIAKMIGKSRRHVYDRMSLFRLTSRIKRSLRNGDIDVSRAQSIAQVSDEKLQADALDFALEENYEGERPSAREVARWIKTNAMAVLKTAPFDTTDATLVPGAGSCKTCPKRTGYNPDLLAEVQGEDTCTDTPCYQQKEAAQVGRQIQAAHDSGQTIITGPAAKKIMAYSGASIDGHMRLDNAQDTPGDSKKTLRTLLKKQLAANPQAVVLVANPNKSGDYISALPNDIAAQMLKDAGLASAANQVQKDIEHEAEYDAKLNEIELKNAYETQWRRDLMQSTWAKIFEIGEDAALVAPIARIVCQRYIGNLNADKAKLLCKTIGLGAVAPKDAVRDFANTTPRPTALLLLLVMEADHHYYGHMPDSFVSNAGLVQVAQQFAVNIGAIKSEAKTKIYPGFVDAAQPTLKPSTERPAALPSADPAAQKGKALKASKPPKPPKLTAQQALSGIAEAMQNEGIEAATPQAVDANGTDALPNQTARHKGEKATVAHAARLRDMVTMWAGREGKINRIITRPELGPTHYYELIFKGKGGGMCEFLSSELEAA